ncbi:MAG: hypothetical protein ACRC46_02095 [Thermoguttaceae bacterium]
MIDVQTPQISILLDGRGRRLYFPRETLSGEYRLGHVGGNEIHAVELSVLWQTEGKGNDDMGVHMFTRRVSRRGDWIDPYTISRFHTQLPETPLSYIGSIIKINWYVRVRLFLHSGEEVVEAQPFRLGNLPDVRLVKPANFRSIG